MIGRLRAGLRLACAALWLVLIAPVVLLSALLAIGSRGRLARNGARVHFVWSRVLLWIFGVRVRVTGPRPPGGAFLASNHLTHFDIPVLASIFPMQFVAKAEIAKWPLFGQLALLAGTIYVDRERRGATPRIVQSMSRYLRHGASVVLFAEGTCGDGLEIARFKPPLFSPPVALGLPTVPVAIRYGGENAAWNGGSMPAHMAKLLRQPRIEVAVRFGQALPPAADRKLLAAEARERVAAMYAELAAAL